MATPMASTTRAGQQAELVLSRKPRTLWSDAWRQFLRHRLAMFGLIVFSFLTLASMFGPLIYTTPIDEINFTQRHQGPSLAHPLGTDDLGQDMLARVLYGGRVSLSVGIVAMLIAVVIGTAFGALAGYFGGILDTALMRFTDLLLSLPQLPFLLVVIYLFRDKLRATVGVETGTFIMMVAVIGGLRWMPVARLVRAQFLSLKEKEFIEAARSLGAPTHRMMLIHLLPNSLSPVIVAGSLAVAAAIIAESSLSFLGVGFPPDQPTWGRLLFDGKELLDVAPQVVLIPGLLISLTVLSINFIGDGLRDALDPRKSRQG